MVRMLVTLMVTSPSMLVTLMVTRLMMMLEMCDMMDLNHPKDNDPCSKSEHYNPFDREKGSILGSPMNHFGHSSEFHNNIQLLLVAVLVRAMVRLLVRVMILCN